MRTGAALGHLALVVGLLLCAPSVLCVNEQYSGWVDQDQANIFERELAVDTWEMSLPPEQIGTDDDERMHSIDPETGEQIGAEIDHYIYQTGHKVKFPEELRPDHAKNEKTKEQIKQIKRGDAAFSKLFHAHKGSKVQYLPPSSGGEMGDPGGVIGRPQLHPQSLAQVTSQQTDLEENKKNGKKSAEEAAEGFAKTLEKLKQPVMNIVSKAARYTGGKANEVKGKLDAAIANPPGASTNVEPGVQDMLNKLKEGAYKPANIFTMNAIQDMKAMWQEADGNLGKEMLVAEFCNIYVLPAIAAVWPTFFYYTLEREAVHYIAPSWWVQDPMPNTPTMGTSVNYKVKDLTPKGIPGASEAFNKMIGLDPEANNIKHHCKLNNNLECVD